MADLKDCGCDGNKDCTFPLCQSEEYQKELETQLVRELITGEDDEAV